MIKGRGVPINKKINSCDQCGVCCQLFLINLTEQEYRSGKYLTHLGRFGFMEDFTEVVKCGANILEYNDDGSCIYLKGQKCSIHESRPEVCRKFFCYSEEDIFQDMIAQIKFKKAQVDRQ